jgi:sulfhydrogenase subunit alpha
MPAAHAVLDGMTHKNDRVLSVKELDRVEGEGALYLRASGNRVEEARLDIYEPPRFFEAFLRGRAYTEPPDITARICGICPATSRIASALSPAKNGWLASSSSIVSACIRSSLP